MKLTDVKTMQALERTAITEYGVPSILLMENAASGFVSALLKDVPDASKKTICVVCGKGNNGGDGFAIARMLYNLGTDVSCVCLVDASCLSGDAKTNYEIVKKMGIPFINVEDCKSKDILIDAIFGTGFHGDTEGEAKKAIDIINESSAFVASVDIPSGVSADTGMASLSSVFADLCVTFSVLKPGHLLFPGKSHIKKLVKTDISIPRAVINDCVSGYDIIDKSAYHKIPARTQNSHKSSFGKVLAFVGSKGMSGAAVLSSSAILKSGAGMVTATIPESIYEPVAKQVAAVMTYVLPCENDVLSANTADLILEKMKSQDVLLMGCGIGTSESAKETVKRVLLENKKPTVLDADGLNALSECTNLLKEASCDLVLTPHIMEFSRLSGVSVDEIKARPIELARAFATEYGVTLVLKDAVTLVATKEGKIYISSVSNSGMATAGSGDVLAGIITGLMAQGASPEDAAASGVYLHLAAGELAKDAFGEYGMTAEDILTNVPIALKEKKNITTYITEI